ncbi:MAG: formyltransferase family protein [Candidatus Gastranaerophilaceae bacterium]|jgi:methionyl-tRNA formyltransferase
MKNILFLTNNNISNPLINFLYNIKGDKIIRYSEKLNLDYLNDVNPNIIISYNYKYIISKDIIERFENKIINLHISLLPYSRGADPNFWSFMDDTAKGVTIHLIDEKIDTGPIILQKELFFDENKETLRISYEKLHFEMQKLFIDNWKLIESLNFKTEKQIGNFTFHKRIEFDKIRLLLESNESNIYDIPIVELKQIYKGLTK